MTKLSVRLSSGMPFLRQCFQGICDFVRQQRPDWTIDHLGNASAGETLPGASALITFAADPVVLDWMDSLAIPVVNLCNKEKTGRVMQVPAADAAIGSLAAGHLWSRGFRKLVYITDSTGMDSRRREESFYARLSEQFGDAQTVIEPLLFLDREGSADRLGSRLQDELSHKSVPIGCLVYDDHLADRVLYECVRRGISVPHEVGIVGVNNNEYLCETRVPSLSSIDAGHRARGFAAARLIDQLLRGEPLDLLNPPPVRLVARGSTGYAATGDALIDQAVTFVQINARRNIGVETLVEHLETNRRTLGRRFREVLGVTPHEWIIREKIDNVKRLLLETDLNHAAIAELSGFARLSHLAAVFKRVTGQTMGEYRASIRGSVKSL